MTRKFKLLAMGAAAASFVSLPASAATDGTLGATSTGNVNINATIAGRVRISGLSDVTFNNVDPGVDASNAQNVCVWSNTATRGYNITATGSGASGAFTLASGALPVVPYSVEWASSSGATSGTALTSGSAQTGLTSAAINPTCASGPSSSASLIVKIGSTALQSMTAGTAYSGTLTLLVAPE
jgi:hypothetical protein